MNYNVSVKLAQSTKSLGVTIENKLTLIERVNIVRKCVSEDVAESRTTSLVGLRLDYCNAVFYGTSCKNIDKLQRVQNTLARVVKERSKYGWRGGVKL